MQSAAIPINESDRLRSLRELKLLDTAAEPQFDAIVNAAALICGTPISLISLVDMNRQWFKANHGLEAATETPRELAFCAHAILSDELLEVTDAAQDVRFFDNPLVTGSPDIRFYAGVPLTLKDGSHIGTLCVIDSVTKQLTLNQRASLIELAKIAVHAMETRKLVIEQTNNGAQFRALCESSPLGIFATDTDGACTYTNARWQSIYSMSLEESLGTGWAKSMHPEDREHVFQTWQHCAENNLDFDMQFRTQLPGGDLRVVHSTARKAIDDNGQCTGFVGTVQDITEKIAAQQINESLLSMIRKQRIMSITDISGDMIEVNDAFCEISGYGRDELLGQNHRIVNSGTHPPSFFQDIWRTISSGNSWRGEICNRSKTGELYWVDSIIAPLRGVDGAIDKYVSIRTDVTKRKIEQDQLRQNKNFLDKIGRIAGVGGWEVDLVENTIFWSDETCRIHGVEIGYKPTLEDAINFYAEEARPIIAKAVEESMKGGKPWDLILPLITQQGKRIYVRAFGSTEFENGVPKRLAGAFQDVTANIEQQKNLEDAKRRFELATEAGQIGIWELDLIQQCLIWDARMFHIYGADQAHENHTYELWAKHLHPDDKAGAERVLTEAISGIREFDTEFRIVRDNGAIRYIRGAAVVIRDSSGAAIRVVGVNWDITDKREAEANLAQQHELLRVTLNSIGDSVITTDHRGEITWLNPVAERMTGWSNEEAFGRPLTQVFHIVNEQTRAPTENPVETCLEQGKIVGLANHTLLISRHGEEYGIEDSAAPIRDERGNLLGVVLVFHDVTEQRRMSGEMSYRATHDELTGLVNRAEFENRLRRLLQLTHEDGSVHALLYIDLDQFKIVNDACGHTAGDQLLQQVSKLMSERVRAGDTLARLGGDEFGIILAHCNAEQAQRVAQQICDRMEEFRFVHDGRRFRVGTSIGLVQISNAFANMAAILQAADTSCYAAKEAGRNRVHTWLDTDQAMRERHGEMQWTERIEHALDEDRFVLFAQRIERLQGNARGIHAEVLIRMLDEDGSIIPPGAFLPAAERFHLASRIDKWVFKQAIAWLQTDENFVAIESLCINLSGQSIGDRAFHRHMMEKLSILDQRICQRLCIEITETAAVTNLADAALFIEGVRSLGIKVALDDFGAGASSFGYLKNLKVDVIKIDGQFIKDIVDDPLDDAAVRCFVDVAKVLGVQTIAEYVDKETVLKRVSELGIDYAQGFYLHKPEPIAHLVCKTVVQECKKSIVSN
jgi:diguanylate cyclase (GGDEF)-like protein/PAS domain S-box-containing protein